MNRFDYACTYAFVHGTSAIKSGIQKSREKMNKIANDESGMEIIAVVLIIVVILALVIIFRKYIIDFFQSIWDKIFGTAGVDKKSDYGDDQKKDTVFAKVIELSLMS